MYSVSRTDNGVTISGPNGTVVYRTTEDAFVAYKDGDQLKVARVKDLDDGALVLALARAVRIITDTKG